MRSTEDKLLAIPLTVGMNQATSPRLSPTGTLYSVKNCRISGNGVLEKRPGSVALSGTTANPGGHTTNAHSLQGDAVNTNVEKPMFVCQVQGALMVGNTYGDAFAYSTVWQFQGRFATCLPVRKRYGLAIDDVSSATGFGKYPPDIAVSVSGYVCVAAISGGNALHLYIEDSAGVRIYYREDDQSTYTRVRVVAQGDTFIFITQTFGNTTLNAITLAIASGQVTSGAPTSVGTLNAAGYNWDATGYDGTGWYIVRQTGPVAMSLARLNLTANVATVNFTVTGSAPVTLWADPVGARLWCGYYDDVAGAGNVGYVVYNISVPAAITLLKAKTTIASSPNVYGPPMFGRYRGNTKVFDALGPAFYCFGNIAASGLCATWSGFELALGGSSGAVPCFHVYPLGKPDNYNRVWCQVLTQSTNQLITKAVLLRFTSITSPPTVELSSPNMPYSGVNTNAYFFGDGGLGATRSVAPIPINLQEFSGSSTLTTFEVYEYTTAEQETHRDTLITGVSTVIAGQPVELWGQSVAVINTPSSGGDLGAFFAGAAEIGFAHAPTILSAVESHTTNALTNGTRSYKCVFEWIDLYGRRHQSAPSAPVSLFVSGVNSSATLTVTTLDISQRQAENTMQFVQLRVYRTVAGGTEYHELVLTMSAHDASGAPTGLVTYVDTEPDVLDATEGFIYTDGGVLNNDLAPATRFMCRTEERVWFGGLWDSTIIQCSKVIVPGEPIQCTDDASHQVLLPGPCTGLAYMDGNVIAFTADAIYLITGDGPNDQGIGSFPAPRALTRSIGCCDYRSIVETNVGVMFQGNLGFYIVPRGFGPVQYVGAAVQDEMIEVSDVSPQVLSSISHQTRDNHLARFLVAVPGTVIANTVLTYDIDSNQWFKDTFPAGIGELGALDSLLGTGSKGAVFVMYDLSTATSVTPVWVESPTTAFDSKGGGNFPIVQYAETSWLHPFGLGGWGKVNVVLLAVEAIGTSQNLTITIQVDDQTPESGSWTVTTTGVVSYRAIYLSNRACTSVQVQITGDAQANEGSGFKFIACTLELENAHGLRLMQDSEKN